MGINATPPLPAWVVTLLESSDADSVRRGARLARLEVHASPAYAGDWRAIADALESHLKSLVAEAT